MSKEITIAFEAVTIFKPGDKVLIPEWVSIRRAARVRRQGESPPFGDPRVATVERVIVSTVIGSPTHIVLVRLYTSALVAFEIGDLRNWRMHDDCETCTCKEPTELKSASKSIKAMMLDQDEEEDEDEEEDL